jgi:hypothetical protein
MSIKRLTSKNAPLDPRALVAQLISELKAVLGPFGAPLKHPSSGKWAFSVVGCKIGKHKEVVKLLGNIDFVTVDRPVAFCAGGMLIEPTGEKTFVNYNAAVGVLTIGTTVQKDIEL